MRMVLPHGWSTARAPTVRLRLYDVTASDRTPCQTMDSEGQRLPPSDDG